MITNLADEYRGRSVFISGGSSGVGAELGRLLARLGARVTLFARSEDRLPLTYKVEAAAEPEMVSVAYEMPR